MLRNIFPDEPAVSDQDSNNEEQDNPGAFFAEFLPRGVATFKEGQAAAAANAAAAAAKASAQEALVAAASAASRAQHLQQQANRQLPPAAAAIAQSRGLAQPPPPRQAAAAATDATKAGIHDGFPVQRSASSSTSSEGLVDLPSLSEIRTAMATAWFGDDDDDDEATAAAAGQGQGGKKQRQDGQGEEEEESVFDRLLPFGKGSVLRRRRHKLAKPKPLRLKLAEQVLSKEMMNAVQLVDEEILSSPQPLPNAIINFFLKAGRTMGKGWARNNANKVFVFAGAYVAATCGVMHGLKVAAKRLAHRLPRVGKRVGPAVDFTADVLLPTSFFGPFMATYVVVMLVCRQQQKPPADEDADAAANAAEGEAGAAVVANGQPKQQQQQVVQQRSLSRELQQLEFVVEDRQSQQRRRGSSSGPLRRRVSMARTTLKSKARRAVSATTPGATAPAVTAAAAASAATADADTEW